jgi:hypothetical protein
VEGVRGSLHDLEETSIISHDWGLGNISNNLDKAYVLQCGLSINKEVDIRALLVFKDSMIFIKAMIIKSSPEGSN